MATLDPKAIELKKAVLAESSISKKEALRQALAPVIQQTLEANNVPLPPQHAIDAAAEIQQRQEGIDAYQQKSDAVLASDFELDTPLGRIKQVYSSVDAGLNRLQQWTDTAFNNFLIADLDSRIPQESKDAWTKEKAYQEKATNLSRQRQNLMAGQALGFYSPEEYSAQMARIDAEEASLAPLSAEELASLDTKKHPVFGGGTRREDLMKRDALVQDVAQTRAEIQNNGVLARRNTKHIDRLDSSLSETWGKHKDTLLEADTLWEQGNKLDAVSKAIPALASLIAEGASDVNENPAAVIDYVAENVPELAGGAYKKGLLLAFNSLYGLETYSNNVEQFKAREGRDPDVDERTEMAAWAMAAAGAEQLGESALLEKVGKTFTRIAPESLTTQGGKISVAVNKALPESVVKAGDDMRAVLAKAAPDGSMRKAALDTAKDVSSSIVTEGATEAFQSGVESGIGSLGEADGEQVFKGGMIGAASGGVITGTTRSGDFVRATLNTLNEGAKKINAGTPEEQERSVSQKEAFTSALDTGNTDELLNPESKAYSPGTAASALAVRLSNKKTPLSDEEKADHTKRFAEIEESLQTQVATLEAEVAATSPEKVKARIARKAEVDEQLKTIADDDPDRPILEAISQNLGASLEAAQAKDKKTIQAESTALAAAKKELGILRQSQDYLKTQTAPDSETLESLVSSVTSPAPDATPEIAQKAATQIIDAMMANPATFTPSQVTDFMSDTAQGFTPEQKSYLRKFSEAQQALNAAKTPTSVRNDIFSGGEGYKGIQEYRADISSALKSGNAKAARREISGVTNFLASHRRKAEALEKANGIQSTMGPKDKLYLVNDLNTPDGWRLVKDEPAGWVQNENGGLVLHGSDKGKAFTKNIARAVRQEAVALEKTLGSMEAAFNLKFPGQQTTTEVPTDEVPLSQYEQDVGQQEAATATKEQITQEKLATAPTQNQSEPQGTETKTPDIRGTRVDQEWTSFTPESGTLNIPRTQMPQVKAEHRGALANFLKGKGISSEEKTVPAASLKPTQQEFSEAKVQKAKAFTGSDRAILVSSDGHIVDGHHQWVAKRDAGEDIRVIQLGAPISQVLDVVKEFPSTTQEAVPGPRTEDTTETEISKTTEPSLEEQLRAAVQKDIQERPDLGDTETTATEQDREPSTTAEEEVTTAEETPDVEEDSETEVEEETTGNPDRIEGTLSTKDFKEKNLMKGYFTVRPGKKSDGSIRPLASMKDFFTALYKDRKLVRNYLKDGDNYTFTDAESNALKAFMKFALDHGPQARKNIENAPYNQQVRYADYAQYFRDEAGKNIPQNVLTAITLAAFTYVAENGGQAFNGDSDIRAILGKRGDENVTNPERALLADAGMREGLVIRSLGRVAADALGMKAHKKAPLEVQSKLEMSLGSQALALLLQAGIVQSHSIEDKMLVRNPSPDVAFGPQPFIRFMRNYAQDGHPLLSAEANDILKANKGSKNVLHRVFGTEAGLVMPSLEPQNFVQKLAQRTRQKVPAVLKKILDKAAKREHYIRQDMLRVRRALPVDILREIAGYKDSNLSHVVLKRAQDSKNATIDRELGHLNEFEALLAEVGMDSPFYLTPNVWRQQRVGILQNMIDPQQSKLQRHNVSMKAWNTEVDPVNDPETFENFQLAVAQAMGVKTDNQSNEETLDLLTQLMEDDTIKQAVEVLMAIEKGESISEAQQRAIADAVAKGGEAFHSLDGLVNWAKYKAANGKPFTTDIMFEVDGKTNGPALALIQMGAIDPEMGERFGFYLEGSQYTNYVEYKSQPGSSDLYEAMATLILENLQKMGISGDTLRHIQLFTGDIAKEDGSISSKGRNLVKQPTTGMAFGAGIKNTVEDMADDFIISIYEKMEEVAASGDQQKMNAVANAIGQMLGMPEFKGNVSAAFLRSQQFDANQEKQLKAVFTKTVGQATEASLDSLFGKFIERRDQMNRAAQAAFEVYNQAFEFLREQKIQELMQKDALANYEGKRKNPKTQKWETTGELKPFQDLTAEQEAEIREQLKALEPVMHTAMSKQTNDRKAGLLAAKIRRATAEYGETAYTGETVFPKNTVPTNNGNDKKNRTRPRGTRSVEANPGVGTVIMLIHALDSTIASFSYNVVEALNIHDALGLGLKDANKGAKELNKNAFQQLAGYSVPLEIHATFNQSLEAYYKLAEQYPELNERLVKVEEALSLFASPKQKSAMTPTTAKALLNNLRDTSEVTAVNAEIEKLGYLSKVAYTDQYVLENGTFTPSAEDKANIQKRLKELEARKAVLEVQEETTEQVSETKKNPAPKKRPKPTRTPAANGVDPDIAAAFEGRDEVTFAEMLPFLRKAYTKIQDPVTKQLYGTVLRVLKDVVAADLPIILVNPNTFMTDSRIPRAIDREGARGGYVRNTNVIGLIGTHSETNGLNFETVIHELVHAATSKKLAHFQKAKDKTSAGYAAAQNLKLILDKVNEYVRANPELSSKFWNERSSEFELLAYGLTNRAFQDEVLRKIQVPRYAANNSAFQRAVNGFKAFLDSVAQLFFGKSNPTAQERTALHAVVENASALFSETLPTNPETDTTVDTDNQIDLMAVSNRWTTQQVFEGLGKLGQGVKDATFRDHLATVLSTVTNTVYGPFGIYKDSAMQGVASTAEEVFLQSLASGKAPFASLAKANLPLTDQEAFTLEAVEMTVRESLVSASITYNELRRLYNEIAPQVKDHHFHKGDWGTATTQEKARAAAIRKFIFTPSKNDEGKSDYLSRFAAAGLAYKPFHDLLGQLQSESRKADTTGKSWGDKLKAWFEQAMSKLAQVITGTRESQTPSERLETLAQNLARAEARRRRKLEIQQGSQQGNFIEELSKGLADNVHNALEKAGNAPFFKDSKNVLARSMGTALKVVGNTERANQIHMVIKEHRDSLFNKRLGVVMSMLNEAKGMNDSNYAFHQLLNLANQHEQHRKHLIDQTAKIIRKNFGRPLTDDERYALTRVVLRTDMAALVDKFSVDRLENLLSEPAQLNREIEKLEKQLAGQFVGYYKDSARALGKFLASGDVTYEHLMMNAHNIAFLGGTGRTSDVTEAEGTAAIKILDPLISLYAMKYSPAEVKQQVAVVMRDELARQDGNGVEVTLRLHRKLQDEALQDLFDGNPVHVMKGYTKEIFNPHVDVKALTVDEGKDYIKAGYVPQETALPQDPLDPTAGEPKFLYVSPDGGLKPYVSGIMQNAGMRERGSTLHSGLYNSGDGEFNAFNAKQQAQMNAKKQRVIAQMLNSSGNFNPETVKGTRMVPILNHAGETVNYRYLMSEQTKDELLQRDNRIDKVMGAIAGSIYDKPHSAQLNRKAVEAMFDQYRKDMGPLSAAYIEFSDESEDPQIREAYRLLPDATKQAIREVWGQNKMYVRNDLYDMTFGYRKFSLTDGFAKDASERAIFEQIFHNTLETLFGDKAARYVRRGEDFWQFLVKQTKDIWVIKNLFTLLGNVRSNISLLVWYGVNPVDLVKNHKIAIAGILSYQRDQERLYEVQRTLDMGTPGINVKELELEVIELEDAIARNPVKELIDAGMLQTIVEDVEQDDAFAYPTQIQRKIGKITNKVPGAVKKVGKQLYMTHDTTSYKVLNKATTLSDFVARYTLHEHLTKRARNPLSKAESLKKVQEAFVNYDVPTHRGIQYANDMGLLFFTKYYIRIQKVIMGLWRDNPGRGLALIALQHYFPGLSLITGSSFVGRLGNNPFDAGALNYPGALGDPITMKMALSPFN